MADQERNWLSFLSVPKRHDGPEKFSMYSKVTQPVVAESKQVAPQLHLWGRNTMPDSVGIYGLASCRLFETTEILEQTVVSWSILP